jgi:nitrite reductase/ring-hydroxylating ferredoxin subunit
VGVTPQESGAFEMSDYLELIGVDELADGEMTSVQTDGHELLVARAGGEFYISDAHCPHLHGPLVKGELVGTVLTCPWHGSQFDLTDGRCVRWTEWTGAVKSMAELVRHARPLRVYEAKVEDGTLFVGPQLPPPDGA